MAASTSSSALAKRPTISDVALMPPPPFKRIKRPSTVLDEDEYTEALSEIIARDYFPGLLESQAQHEYLAALESENETWIAEAAQNLREAAMPANSKRRNGARNTRFDATPSATPRWTPVADTPLGYTGSETPMTTSDTMASSSSANQQSKKLNTSSLSLGSFQAKYTSEDNESFNTVLDKLNQKRREKHAHMWTQDQRILSARQITHRAQETKLIQQRQQDEEAAGKQLVPMTTGATSSRPAKPDSWNIKRPDNTFMFPATSVDEEGLQTVQEVKEANSKAGPKHVVHSNTRFPPQLYLDDPGPVPASPSLNTDIITRRDARRATGAATPTITGSESHNGAETPRVNGYAFVDEDEPNNNPIQQPATTTPSYRDLLAGQTGDGTPNPFRISDVKKRESVHLRMLEKTARRNREKERETMRTPITGSGSSGVEGRRQAAGNMTPAARKLMDKLGGRTPVTASEGAAKGEHGGRGISIDWTPGRTPRRSRIGK